MKREEQTVWKTDKGRVLLTTEEEEDIKVCPAFLNREDARQLRDALIDWLGEGGKTNPDPFTQLSSLMHHHTEDALQVLRYSPRFSPGKEWFLDERGCFDYHNSVPAPANKEVSE